MNASRILPCATILLACVAIGFADDGDGSATNAVIPGAVFRDTEYGAYPHYGDLNSPGSTYPHYDFESQHYGHWYRPRAFGLGKAQRCQVRPFRPRGFGNLDNRPCNCYRVDYHPFVLKDATSRFGPSYYRRVPDPRCEGDYLLKDRGGTGE